MSQIVVGVDESQGAAHALRWAVREGELRGWTVTAVLAWGLLDQHYAPGVDRFDPAYGGDDAHEALAKIVRRAVGGDAAAGVERRVVCDLPARALLDASDGGELLVVGARGLGGFRGLLLGSVSQHCLQHARTPVAVVREQVPIASTKPERIVVAVDGSDSSHRALQWALEEARVREAGLDLVNAWSAPFIGSYFYVPVASDLELCEKTSRQILEEAMSAAGTGAAGVPVEPISAEGAPAAVILDVAQGADLIVMGSRGRSALKGMLLGSVTNQVAHHALCPVVVVPPVPDAGADPLLVRYEEA